MIETDRGYLILAMNFDEQKNAATCAYSVKIRNPDAQVSLIVPNEDAVYEHLKEPFDDIIQLPYGYHDVRRANDWQLYWATPYKYNIVLDCYTLVEENHDNIWEYLSDNYSVAFNSSARDFKGFEYETPYELPDSEMTKVNSSIWFFAAEDEEAVEYFKMADPILQWWEASIDETIGKRFRNKWYSPDLMHSIIVDRMWDKDRFITDAFDIVDMQISIEMFDRKIKDSWTEYINHWVTDSTKVKVQNYNISGTFSYITPDVVDEEIYERHRDYYRLVTK